MSYAPFYELFPDIAAKETRTLTVFDRPDLPPGDYGLVEAYCDEVGCDCRRVFFNVVEAQTGQVKAVIAYGWESKVFYRRWLGFDEDPAIMQELKGPALNSASRQSPLAPALLRYVTHILTDQDYVERLKRHYDMYKAAISKGTGKQVGTPRATAPKRVQRRRKKR